MTQRGEQGYLRGSLTWTALHVLGLAAGQRDSSLRGIEGRGDREASSRQSKHDSSCLGLRAVRYDVARLAPCTAWLAMSAEPTYVVAQHTCMLRA